jgi:LysR family transcriptional regulator, transcriptional activator for dmlA
MQPNTDLNDVRIFVAAVDAGSMSGAAKILRLPTSTVSRSIARFQKNLGLLLVRRGKSGIVLTDAGQEYLPSCRHALRLLQDGQEALSRQAEQPVGVIRVACPATMAREVMAPLIPALLKRYPTLGVDMIPYTPGRDQPPNVDIDVLFHIWPEDKKGNITRTFPSTRRGIYTSKRYAGVAGIPRMPEDLALFDCLGSRGVPAFSKWHLRSEKQEVQLELSYQFMAADPATLRNLLLEGLGITILPVWMALEENVEAQLLRILPDWEPTPVPLLATYSRSRLSLPKVKFFLDFMGEHLGTALDPRAVRKRAEECFA